MSRKLTAPRRRRVLVSIDKAIKPVQDARKALIGRPSVNEREKGVRLLATAMRHLLANDGALAGYWVSSAISYIATAQHQTAWTLEDFSHSSLDHYFGAPSGLVISYLDDAIEHIGTATRNIETAGRWP